MAADRDPGCPQGTMAPPYYTNDGTLQCNTIGKTCSHFENDLTCACDHHWWYSYTHCSDNGGTCYPDLGAKLSCDGGS
jgi:hypothetical protein